MQFTAKALGIQISPFKLRPLANVIRGKNALYVLEWLKTYAMRRARPLYKVVSSATANAKYLQNIDSSKLIVQEIRIDQGPIFKYYKPGAMGRSNVQRKRFSHISIVLKTIDNKED